MFLGIVGIGCAVYAGGGRNRVAGGEASVTPVRAPVTADGDLGEWDASQAKLLTLFTRGGEDTQSEAPLDKYSAKISFQYDRDALYVAVWWRDPTPLGRETSKGCFPAGDGLALDLPLKRMAHAAFWRGPRGTGIHAVMADGGTPLSEGKPLKGVAQGYRVTGKDSYTQELRIPWDALGGRLEPGGTARLGVGLCYGGLDAAASYKACRRDRENGVTSDGNRWGGNMGWGFMDGLRSPDQMAPSYDPATGAEVGLMPAGSAAPPNPAVLYQGNEQTRTTRMIAVPAKKITVDGMLGADEWAAESATTIASEPTLFPNRYAADVHFAYDEKGLYAGLRWRTGGPYLNINDPAKEGRGYDGGDALQLRLATDRVSHIDAWYCDEGKLPGIVIDYGTRLNEGRETGALSKGAQLALRPAEGGGYTEEIFLPWALITRTGEALKAGASFRAVFDLFFSGLEGNRIPFIVNAGVEQSVGVVTLPFTAPEDGFYTAVVDDLSKRQAIRRLSALAKMRKGQTIEWDGLGDDGKPAPAGAYAFRGLRHQGIGLNYLMTYNNPGTPPWQNDDGSGDWGGDHSPPQTAAADSNGVYLGWPTAEDGYGIIGCDFSGKKRWGFFMAPLPLGPGATAILASDEKYLYYANEGKENIPPKKDDKELAYFKTVITCLDRATGLKSGFSVGKPYHELAAHKASQVKLNWWWDLWKDKDFSLDTYALHDDYYYSGRCAGGNLAGLAARDGKLYVSFRLTGEIAVYSRADMTELARWKIDKPAGLAFTKNGGLLAISGATVVRINPETGAPAPLVRAGLDAPVALAVDADDAIYVSDWAGAQCVKVFGKDGVPARVIGIPGGRPWLGKYDPKGMLLPRGIAIDKNNRLWVCEDDNQPRRISLWDAKSGAFIREFIGGTAYGAANGGMLDPKDPSRAISGGCWFEIDLCKEGYRPLSTIWRRLNRDQYFGFGPSLADNSASSVRFVEQKGRRFVLSNSGSAVIVGELMKDGSWVPLAAVGGIFKRGDNPEAMADDKLTWRMRAPPSFFPKHAGENYVWTDLNGDGMAQEEEFQWRKQDPKTFPCWSAYWGVGMTDRDMNVFIAAGLNDLVACFPLQGWTDKGLPKYDINKCEIVADNVDTGLGALAVDKDRQVFSVAESNCRYWMKGRKPALAAHGKDGKLTWLIPASEDGRPIANINGECIMGPVDLGGEIGEVISTSQWHGLHVPLITTDGLMFGRLLRDPADGGEPGPDMYRGECIQYLNKLDDGRVILSHGKNAHHLFEITGLDKVKRFQGEFTLTDGQAKRAEQLLDEAKTKQEKSAPVRLVTVRDAVNVDGKFDEWDWTTASSVGPKEGAPRAESALRTDGKTLYLAYRVFKNGPFVNKGDDIRQLFVSGDAVDLQLCVEPAADPARKVPVMGDCRLLISKLGGKPVAMLYRVKAPGAKQPVSFRNPGGTEVVFDEVSEIKDAKVAISDTPDGYLVEAAIPLKVLFDFYEPLWKGRVLQGDIGVIVADSTSRRIARIYRFNRQTQIVSDLPSEARLSPANWGEIEVQ